MVPYSRFGRREGRASHKNDPAGDVAWSTMSIAFSRDPRIKFRSRDVAPLAKKHGVDKELMEMILADAATKYRTSEWIRREGYDGPDSLYQLVEPLGRVLSLLQDKKNRHRLIVQFIQAGDRDLVVTELDQFLAEKPYREHLAFLERAMVHAAAAHEAARRGRPVKQFALIAAYQSLSRIWQALGGKLVNGWRGREPTSDAARFFYDVLQMVAPDRPRLAQELRRLMADDVTTIPGPRVGRREEKS